ncbi:M48 family metallopeptidase [Melaminivora suipulveris]|uniref:M48 family metallopeptidase n=1 Tax=Melaminivora suipulveris TaxID=2109913 RepID=UPI001F309C8E|nr:SprT family zinc-dependent metalloprotease [Melaminivora suipulveris]
MEIIDLGDTTAEVIRKPIKHVHLSVYPPNGRVRVSAPKQMALDTIRVFAISRLPWIRAQQRKVRAQEREPPREYIERESHYLWGRRYLLTVMEDEAAPRVVRQSNRIVLTVRPGTATERRAQLLDAWYREQIRATLPPLLDKWQALMKVQASRVHVQRMKTKWGSCNPASRSIRLNTELAKKPPECLEYVLVHELAHLIERRHDARFRALMDRFMPRWQQYRDELNQLPVRHERWDG